MGDAGRRLPPARLPEDNIVSKGMGAAQGFAADETGATLLEYALAGFLIAATCVLAVGAVGANLLALHQVVCNAVTTAIAGAPAC